MLTIRSKGAVALTAVAALLACAAATAQPEDRRFGGPGPHVRFDDRYHHDHYYPLRGEAVGVLPGGAIGIGFHGGNWYYRSGVWFRPGPGGYVVDVPPVGILVPTLPPDYATVQFAGAPYYYANGVYYAPAPGQGYQVVDAPPGADSAQPVMAPPPPPPMQAQRAVVPPSAQPDPIYYPRNGQTEAQTESDRQACNRWATSQRGAMADANVFQRAASACMDGRGYTVR